MHHLARFFRVFTVVCAPLLLLGLLPQQAAAVPAAAPEHPVYTGTVHAVQAKTGTLELITGVGFALRLVQISTRSSTELTSEGAAIQLTDLAPGDVVRAECTVADSGPVADHIERLPAPESGP